LSADLPTVAGDDDVLLQPTRRRLYALISELGGAATTELLSERLGMHPNGVRAHLIRMRQAGLLERRTVPIPRGRPRHEWAISATARPGGDAPEAYRLVARWLARSIPATPARLAEVEQAGREIGRELASPVGTTAERGLRDVLAALGFQPRFERRGDGVLDCRLGSCPYRDSVRINQEVVCTLHRGLTRGILDRLAPQATLARFLPRDPDTAGCEVAVAGLPATAP
jgi:predicted ArsR family transcriptional regulator